MCEGELIMYFSCISPHPTPFDSFTSSEKNLLMNKRLHVVKYQWLEDCMERDKRLQEETYSLKTIEVEDSSTVEW